MSVCLFFRLPSLGSSLSLCLSVYVSIYLFTCLGSLACPSSFVSISLSLYISERMCVSTAAAVAARRLFNSDYPLTSQQARVAKSPFTPLFLSLSWFSMSSPRPLTVAHAFHTPDSRREHTCTSLGGPLTDEASSSLLLSFLSLSLFVSFLFLSSSFFRREGGLCSALSDVR